MASPWDTFFAPMASGTDEQGKTFYSPDITNADEKVIDHWADRARTIEHPVLKARYADLAWDMCAVIAKRRRDPEMARLAIDSYIASLSLNILPDIHDRYEASLRALDLACLIRDPERIKLAREGLMELFQEGIHAKKGLWWWAFDRLIRNDNTGLTDKEKNELIEGLEMLIQNYGDIASPEKFDPHLLEGAAERLIRYYSRLHRGDDVRRLYAAIARAFEHFAGLGNAMLASAVLQTAVNAYRNAGLREDSERVRILMQEKIGQSHDHMVPIETKMEISREDMEKFLKAIVVDDLWSTFAKIAFEFLPARYSLEEQLRETSKNTPLTALMPLSIVADNHVAAKIGSIEDDPFGRLINYTETNLNLSVFWLHHIFNATMEKHVPAPEHFVAWANRLGLFEDVTFFWRESKPGLRVI
jgi:lysyl-tRNA synthetase class 1